MTTSLTQRPGREELLLNATPEQINALNRLVYRDSEPLPVELRDNPMYRRNLGFAAVRLGEGIISDINKDIEIENLAEKNERQGLDLLTSDYGIYNPHGFNEAMQRRDSYLWSQREKDTQSKPQGTLVIFIDGDDFGEINKMFDHSVGDEAIRTLAGIICDNVRDEDIVCRRGGDEFVVVADIFTKDNEAAEQQAEDIAARLKGALGKINDSKTGLKSATIGTNYLVGPKVSTAVKTAIGEADKAMRANKRARKERVIYN